jgi:carboxypeptidase Taq
LGNLNAAALYAAAKRDIPQLEDAMARGEFSPLLSWLREHVHRFGSRYPSKELMQRATGEELSVQPLLEHLEAKVARYYGE